MDNQMGRGAVRSIGEMQLEMTKDEGPKEVSERG